MSSTQKYNEEGHKLLQSVLLQIKKKIAYNMTFQTSVYASTTSKEGWMDGWYGWTSEPTDDWEKEEGNRKVRNEEKKEQRKKYKYMRIKSDNICYFNDMHACLVTSVRRNTNWRELKKGLNFKCMLPKTRERAL